MARLFWATWTRKRGQENNKTGFATFLGKRQETSAKPARRRHFMRLTGDFEREIAQPAGAGAKARSGLSSAAVAAFATPGEPVRNRITRP
jgi:hypothetical protein